MKREKWMFITLACCLPFLFAFRFGGEIKFDNPVKFQVDNSCSNAVFQDVAVGDVDGDGDADLIMIKSIHTTRAECGNVIQNEVRVYFNQCTEQGGCGAGGGVVAIDKLFFPRPGAGPNDTQIDAFDGNQKMAVIYADGWQVDPGVVSPNPYFPRPYQGAGPGNCPGGLASNSDVKAPFTRLAVVYKTVVVGGNNRNVVDYILVSRRFYGERNYYNGSAAGRILHLRNPFTGANPGETMLPWPSRNGRTQEVFYDDDGLGGLGAKSDRTAESKTPLGTAYTLLGNTSSEFFVGGDVTFGNVSFGVATPGSGLILKAQYYGSAVAGPPAVAEGWRDLTVISDGTNSFSRSGTISFVIPADWMMTNLSGVAGNKYWIKFSTSSLTTPPTAHWTVIPHSGHLRHFTCSTSDAQFYTDDYTFRIPVGDADWMTTFNAFDLGDLNGVNGADIYAAPHFYINALLSGNQVGPLTTLIYRYFNDGTNNFNNAYNPANPGANYSGWADSSSPAGVRAQMWDMHIVDMDKDGIPDVLSLLGGGGTYRLSWVQGLANGNLSGDLKRNQIGDGGTMLDIHPGNLRTKSGDPWPADNPKGSPDLVCIRLATPKIEISMYSDWRKRGDPPGMGTMSEWITVYDGTLDPDYNTLNPPWWLYHVGFRRVALADVDGCGMNEIIAITGGGVEGIVPFAGRAQFWIFKNSKSTHSVQYLTMNARED